MARRSSDILYKAAGSYELMPDLVKKAPVNFEFLGQVSGNKIEEFYKNSRFIVLCSICFEGFPMVLVEAMLRGLPVICSRIGGLPEIVEDGETGLLFEPGDTEELAGKIRFLWERPELCRKMGKAGREKVIKEFSPEKYYQRLMAVYNKALDNSHSVG
ncbi:MAG: glycosyltransferase family 4 protein [Deltaproteobacteria bacterium]|nr:glycosyltransferase family 4 protein [Deltaproteobacteria bacterium]